MKSELDSGWGFELGGIRWGRVAVLGLLASALLATAVERRDNKECDSKPKELSGYMICVDGEKTIKIFPRFGSTRYEIKKATLVLATEEKIYFYRTEPQDESVIINYSVDPQNGEELYYGRHRR
jgi:hypothetical protein